MAFAAGMTPLAASAAGAPAAKPAPIAVAMRPANDLKLFADGNTASSSFTGNELYLETLLNLSPTGQLARFVEIDGKFFASAATLRELGLQWPGSDGATGLLALEDIAGLQADYDASQQRMLLQVPVSMLAREPTHFSPLPSTFPRPDPAMHAPGLILNYDLHAQRSHGNTHVSAFSEVRLFGLGPGLWSNTTSHRLADTHGKGRRYDSVRLDTAWQLDFPDSLLSLTIGDSIGGALSWSRATRIGGVRIARDFGLQPYRVTTPLASFAGEAVLPSTVDLFINGIKQSSQQVAPGQFQIDSMPSLNGAGTAQMVVTDINGVSRTLDFSFYGAPRLLEAGLSDWSVDLGWVRRDYGLESFSYADSPALIASTRHGLNKRFTLEMLTEAAHGLSLAGVGGLWLPSPRSGLFTASVAGSNHGDDSAFGSQRSFGYQWSGRGFSFNASRIRRSGGFRDVASLEGASLPTLTEQAFVGLSTPLGQWSTGFVQQRYAENSRSRYLTLGWSRQFPHLNNVSLSLFRDLEQGDNNLWLSWSVSLDRRIQASASLRRDGDSHSVAMQASRSTDSDLGGWGWRVQASQSEGRHRSGQAQLDWLNDYGYWNAGLADYGNGDSAWANGRGSLLWMAGRTQPMRHADNAFAMVSTSGVPDVPVRLENRLVGHTDANGLLFVDRLNPWQANKLSIDPLDLPADMRIDTTELAAVPAGRRGLIARFPMRRILSLQVGVVDAAGKPLRAGDPVWPEDADPAREAPLTVIGHDSLLHLQDPPAGARLRVRTEAGFCGIILPELAQTGGFAELEGIVCK